MGDYDKYGYGKLTKKQLRDIVEQLKPIVPELSNKITLSTYEYRMTSEFRELHKEHIDK